MANWYDGAKAITAGGPDDNISSSRFPELPVGSYPLSDIKALSVKHPNAGQTVNGFAIAKDRKLSFIQFTSGDKVYRISARQLQRESSKELGLGSKTTMTSLAAALEGKTLKVLAEMVNCTEYDRTTPRHKWTFASEE